MTTNSVKRAKAVEVALGRGTLTEARNRTTFYLLKVAELDRITDDAVAITFDVPSHLKEKFTFVPGQHVAVRAPIAGDNVRRNYSICAPVSTGRLRIGVKRLPDGVFSGFALERLRVGDTMEVLTPTGSFVAELDPQQSQHYGAIAAGSGITPVLSILSSALEVEPGSQATLIFVNKTTSSIMFLEELADLKNTYMDRLQIFHVLDGEQQGADILSGRLDAGRLTTILEGFDSRDVDEWYLCGPLPMTDMAREVLLSRGSADPNIHRELFHATAVAPRQVPKVASTDAGGFNITVKLDGRGTRFKLQPGTETILDAALTLRSEIPYACKSGICGTCRCHLDEGDVEMVQNFALEADEVDSGYILACQSYPTSDNVQIDFDQ